MNTIEPFKEFVLYDKPKIDFVFTEDCVNNRHNRRKQKAIKRKNNKKNGKYYN